MFETVAVYIHIALLNTLVHRYMFMSFAAAHRYLEDICCLKTA